ncbi:uncharacterized protein LOC143791061 isoform X2 [Ranitomeya variabilis]|uniref:uncharacterized protein LOC143791061 isoform X2 n=2 Tax=Ranitomeya variabilis TaxID=490064 RepID=UPI00405798BB
MPGWELHRTRKKENSEHLGMDRYRYFIFNQRSMVVLGILQIACAGVSVVCGFMDGAFRKESTLGKTRAPLWAGMIMAVPGVLALFSSQKKNPILVNTLIASAVFSCFTTVIIIVYACLTLSYGEDDDEVFSHTPVHIVHTKFILGQLVRGANIAMLVASFFSLCVVLCIALMGCRSLPHCMCYDNITGMEVMTGYSMLLYNSLNLAQKQKKSFLDLLRTSDFLDLLNVIQGFSITTRTELNSFLSW